MTRVKYLRQMRELPQWKLAELTGLDQPKVSLIEQGRLIPTDKQRKALASVLGCDPAALLDEVRS
jgi:transcriptional regulator with XRE-family HTH domain